MNYKDKLAEAKVLLADALAVMANAEATGEEKEAAAKKFDDAQRLKAEAMKLKEISMTAAEVDAQLEGAQQKAAEVDRRQDKEVQARRDTREFKDWTEYLIAVWNASPKSLNRYIDGRLQTFREQSSDRDTQEQKQMVESVGASGGFLVPTEFMAQLQAIQGESSVVRRQNPTVIRMRRRAIQLPVLDQTATGSSGVPCWFGGMKFYWTEEAESKDDTTASFRQVELVAHKLVGYTRASDELLDDSAISLSDFLSGPMGLAGGISWFEDYTFLRGTGAGQPLGVLNAGATIVVPRAAAGAIGFADLANMMENFLPSGRGAWFITQSAMSELIQLTGPVGNPAYIWQPNARDGVPGYILGFPVIWTEKLPLIGVQGDILLADWRYYLIGDRQATTVETTQYDYWRYDQTSWRAVHRVDGQPWLSAPLTYQDQTTRVSPFVILGDVST